MEKCGAGLEPGLSLWSGIWARPGCPPPLTLDSPSGMGRPARLESSASLCSSWEEMEAVLGHGLRGQLLLNTGPSLTHTASLN